MGRGSASKMRGRWEKKEALGSSMGFRSQSGEKEQMPISSYALWQQTLDL